MDLSYAIIKNSLLQSIKDGIYRPGDRIPPEAELCAEFGVSRSTVSHAVQDLVAQGYLLRRRGSGTFVHSGVMRGGLTGITSFTERMKHFPGKLTTAVLERKVIPATQRIAVCLNVKLGDPIIYLKRLRSVDGKPLYIGNSYLKPSAFFWVMSEDLAKNSLFDLLENKYGHKLGGAWQSISVGYLPTEADCAALEIANDEPCLKIEALCSLSDGTPVQADVNYFVGSKYAHDQYIRR